jgi:hypothetical protein
VARFLLERWTLGFNSYPHRIALLNGHEAMLEYLYAGSDTTTGPEAEEIANAHREIAPGLPDVERELVGRYCWETNTNYAAVKLMLDVGFPVAHLERSHAYTPLQHATAPRHCTTPLHYATAPRRMGRVG